MWSVIAFTTHCTTIIDVDAQVERKSSHASVQNINARGKKQVKKTRSGVDGGACLGMQKIACVAACLPNILITPTPR